MNWIRDIRAIKCETEAEGADFAKIAFFNSIAKQQGVPLVVKIGGCEALNDIQQIININVEGIVAPMVESDFAALKFCHALQVFSYKFGIRTITIETKTAINNLDEITSISRDSITNVTFGRSDLAASYRDGRKPNDDVIWNILENSAARLRLYHGHLKLTVGGSIDSATFAIAQSRLCRLAVLFDFWETRRFVIDFSACESAGILHDIIGLEALYEERYYRTFGEVASKNLKRAGNLGDRTSVHQQRGDAGGPKVEHGVETDEYCPADG
jgi:hypothetical protein